MEEYWADGVLTEQSRVRTRDSSEALMPRFVQLKWGLLATGKGVMNETDLASTILNMLITICRFYPSRFVFLLMIKLKKSLLSNWLYVYTNIYY